MGVDPFSVVSIRFLPLAPEAAAVSEGEGVCEGYAFQPLANRRQNYSLAAEFYRNANSDSERIYHREAYCGAAVYLRWLLANAPTFTGAEPDDRNYRRMADAQEFFALLPGADRRAYLDSALDLRAQADMARRELELTVDLWASNIREGTFYFANSDIYPDAERLEFEAFNRALEAQPEKVDDWYLRRLVELSAEWTESKRERAAYLEALAEHVDDNAFKTYLLALIEALRYKPLAPESSLIPLTTYVGHFESGEYADCEPLAEIRTLVALASREPERIAVVGGNPDAIIDSLLDCLTADIEVPPQLFALFVRSWKRGDHGTAEGYYGRAMTSASSNSQRADFAYSRVARGFGTPVRSATDHLPSHGPSLYQKAVQSAEQIGSPSGVRGRAAYWCLADDFRAVAATGDPRVADSARQQAQRYESAAPTREQYIFETDWKPGDSIRAASGGVSCSTRVR